MPATLGLEESGIEETYTLDWLISDLRRVLQVCVAALVLDRTYPLRDTPAAIRYQQTARADGKVVITV